MRVAMRNDQHVTCCDGHFVSIAETGNSIAFGHQVITDDAFRSRRQRMRIFAQRGYRDAPGAGAFGAVEDRAGHAHRIERLG